MKNVSKVFGNSPQWTKILPLVIALVVLQTAIVTGQAAGTAGLVYTGINGNNEYMVSGGTAMTGAIVIPAIHNNKPVTAINIEAFKGSAITSVTIGSNVTTIHTKAFMDCANLKTVTIPNSVRTIEMSAFENSGITSVIIPDSVDKLDSRTFYGCRNLTSVTIGKFVTSIAGGTFGNCLSLERITIPSNVTSIQGDAFNGCNSLVRVTIQGTITSLNFSRNAFPGDLRDKYLIPDQRSGGTGTYTRPNGSSRTWLKV